jgi:ABC-type nickel/cobalt efflux system permease component RcnA
METVIAYVYVLVAVWLAMNAWATLVVMRDPYAERHQKAFQLAAVWLVPIFGLILVFALHRKPEAPTGTYRQSEAPRWDDVTTTTHVGRAIDRTADD